MKKKFVLTKKDRKQLHEALASETFDETLNRVPAVILDMLFDATGGLKGVRDMFSTDMFPNGLKPDSLEKTAQLEAKVEALWKWKHRKSKCPGFEC